MMKNRKTILLPVLLMLLMLAQGCTLSDQSCSFWQPLMWPVISENRENMRRLRIGMTRNEVVKIMGKPNEGFPFNSNRVWWYYTKMRILDLQATRDECSPIVFDDYTGRLIGFGNDYYYENHRFSVWSDALVERSIRQ